MVVREGMGVEELRGLVRKTVGDCVVVKRLWYSLKYDRHMIMVVDGDMHVRMMFKGNDAYGYVYVSGKDSLLHGVSNAIGARAGETGAVDQGTRVRRSSRWDDGGGAEEIQASGAHGSRKW